MKEIVMQFRPAEYYPGKDSYVGFYAYNPNTMQLERVKHRVNHISEKQRKKYAMVMVDQLNRKLYQGWNPLNKLTTNKGLKLKDAIATFIKTKHQELRPDSMRTYISLTKYLLDWIDHHGMDISAQQFEKGYANKIMTEVGELKGLRTYNSYLGFFKILFNWLIEQEYCTHNPFEHMKKKQVEEKDREVIDREWREKIWNWMQKNNPNLQMIASLVYYCFIRPKEISFLKPGHFDLTNQTIYIPPDASKNRKGQRVTIPDEAIGFMRNWMKQRAIDKEDFLFSNPRTLRHGEAMMDSRCFAKAWNKMKEQLKFRDTYQLYSLKDTGIVQMLEDGVPPNEVMIQARHHDLSVTTEYLKHTTRANSQHGVKTKTTSFTTSTRKKG